MEKELDVVSVTIFFFNAMENTIIDKHDDEKENEEDQGRYIYRFCIFVGNKE